MRGCVDEEMSGMVCVVVLWCSRSLLLKTVVESVLPQVRGACCSGGLWISRVLMVGSMGTSKQPHASVVCASNVSGLEMAKVKAAWSGGSLGG